VTLSPAATIALTQDGGVIVAGSGGFVVAGSALDGPSVWVIKTNPRGVPEWERNYYLTGYRYTMSIGNVLQTRDGGYLLEGEVYSVRGPQCELFVCLNPWLIRLDHKGDVMWTQLYNTGSFSFVEQTTDGGYIAAGNFGSINGSSSNGWILKMDQRGSIVWQETFEGQDVYSVDQTRDGGFVVSGTVCVCGPTSTSAAAWVFKLDQNGKVVWEKAYLVSGRSDAYSVKQTQEGGYIVAGHSSLGALILKLDRTGNVVWQKSYSGSGFTAGSISETSDGGSILVGQAGLQGTFLLRLDGQGNEIWLKTYGANGFIGEVQETRQGDIIAAGSFPIIAGTYCCGEAAWVLKLDSTGNAEGCQLADPSNATLTDTNAEVTSTTVAAVSTNASARSTSLTTNMLQASLQTQCPSMGDTNLERDDLRRR